MRSRNRIIIGVLATAGLVVSSVAIAENVSFAGSACSESLIETGAAWRIEGSIYNISSSNIGFTCPIVRPNSDSSGNITAVRVRVYDNHSSAAVECRAVSCDSLRDNCSYADWEASASVQKTSLTLDDMATYTNGFAYIECVVPAYQNGQVSGIISYKIAD
jgi:hypothetical protein